MEVFITCPIKKFQYLHEPHSTNNGSPLYQTGVSVLLSFDLLHTSFIKVELLPIKLMQHSPAQLSKISNRMT